MKDLSKEFSVNKLAAAIVPNVGQFKSIPENQAFLIERIKLLENSLNSDSMDEQTRKSIEVEKQMIAQSLNWMSVEW